MNFEQYRNLMWHLTYVESLLENAAAVTAPEGYCECPVCKAKFPAFLPSEQSLKPSSFCPNCRSLHRHRALALLMQNMDWHRKGMRVLHFAPEQGFYQLFSSFKDIEYWPVDLNLNAFGVKKSVDITNITFDDDSFDLIMCTHVLEHIPDDRKAMRELYRVLKPKTGIAFLNVPMFNLPVTFEDPAINTPELRLKYYGQEDHVRLYGLDFSQRLAKAGFSVQMCDIEDMDDKLVRRHGLKRTEKIFLCRKE